MPSFHTGLWSSDANGEAFAIVGAGWTLEKASGRFQGGVQEAQKYAEQVRIQRGIVPALNYVDTHDCWVSTEILIRAQNQPTAARAYNLLLASMAVCDAGITLLPEPFEHDLEKEGLEPSRLFVMDRSGYLRPCMLAARASRKRSLSYAVHKLHLSYRSASPHIVDLDPTSSPKRFGVYADPIFHVYIANAITLAYSAIEELDLEVRMVKGHNTRLPGGAWDPVTKQDLERRLIAAHINLADTYVWTLRGPRTRVEAKSRPQGLRKAKWSHGQVRDIEMPVIDAISLARVLRSSITTHAFSDSARSLTAYDANNVQSLARQLIMGRLKVW